MEILILIIETCSLYLLVSLSFVFLYYPTRVFNIAHGAVITVGAYTAYFLSQSIGLTAWLAILASVVVSMCLGVVLERAVYSPMRNKGKKPLSMLIASIGLYAIVQNMISLTFGDDTKTLGNGQIKVGHALFGTYITDVQIITLVVSVILFITCLLFTRYTMLGKAIRAVAVNAELANVFGISSDKTIMAACAIGSALGAIAGILFAFDTDLTPTMGFSLLLYGIVAMIIGGVGSTNGLIVGALILSTTQHLAAFFLDIEWMDAVSYLLLIFFLIWKPLGVSGNPMKKIEV